MHKPAALLISAFLLSALSPISQGRLFRWVDENGNVHYSDSIPPDQMKAGHTELSEKGVRIKSVPRAKTPEELRKEQELDRLRAEQKKLLEEQRSADQMLLRTFRSEDDILMARDGKITAIDVMIGITKNTILRRQERLVKLLAQAADLERVGKPVPPQHRDSIAHLEHAIRDSYVTILEREKQKSTIRTESERDLARFRQLKNLPQSEFPTQPRGKRSTLHNLVACPDPAECDRLWAKATDYVRRHATTAVQASSSVVFITAPPGDEQDISLILSRIQDKKGPGASLFLDLQCKRTANGRDFCQGQEAQAVIQGFRAVLGGADQPLTPPPN
jgi:hypothetical protein